MSTPGSRNGRPANGRSLVVDITPDDELWAQKQDRWACAIVRAIQRELPQALRVRADTNEIAFTLPDDGKDGIRYFFQTPPEAITNIIKPLDEGRPLGENRTFILEAAYAAEPMTHTTRDQRAKQREYKRRAPKARGSGAVRTINRFLDYVATEEEDPTS